MTLVSIVVLLFISGNFLTKAEATKNTPCSVGTTAASPVGVAADSSSNVWFNMLGATGGGSLVDTLEKMPSGNTNCNAIVKYSASSNVQSTQQFLVYDPTNGNIAYTMKGSNTGSTPNTCITGWKPATAQRLGALCLTNKGLDDVDVDPINANYVWASMYYAGQIIHYNEVAGTYDHIISLPTTYCPTGSSPHPEGVRVDSNGNVWVADEGCGAIDEYTTFGFWSSYQVINNNLPWFVSIDDPNQNLWLVSQFGGANHGGFMQSMDMGSGSFTTVPLPPGGAAINPLGIDVDSTNSRVAVSFSSNFVNIYNYGTQSWKCGTNGDAYALGTDPFGIRAVGTSSYYVALYGTSQLGSGSC